ncbi:hypothetical protein, partial [Neoroseomonas soli]
MPDLLRRWPHLPAFFPDAAVLPWTPVAAPDDLLALPAGEAAPPAWGGRTLRLTPGPFAPPRFGTRAVPAVLLAAEGADPVAAALAAAPPPAA